ncbi:hypothetical protein ACFPRL_10355 [Pseudoclavibacter helvolus]
MRTTTTVVQSQIRAVDRGSLNAGMSHVYPKCAARVPVRQRASSCEE